MLNLNKKHIEKIIITTLGILAIVSVLKGIYNAQLNYVDFQYFGACNFINGISPYSLSLSGLSDFSTPNYWHSLYITMSPLCLFEPKLASLIWSIFNVALGVFCAVKICKVNDLSSKVTLYITLFFLMSLPFRNGIGNSQNQILMLGFFTFALLSQSKYWGGFFTALSFSKYTFFPSLFGTLLKVAKEKIFTGLIFGGVITSLGVFIIYDGNFLQSLFGPIMVAINGGVSPGNADLLTISDYFFGKDNELRLYVIFLLLFLNIFSAYFCAKREAGIAYNLAISSTLSLMFLTHLGYDGVFLLPAFCYLASKCSPIKWLGLGLIIYHWQIAKLIYIFDIIEDGLFLATINFITYAIIIVIIYKFGNGER
jgi:hypothetical protein